MSNDEVTGRPLWLTKSTKAPTRASLAGRPPQFVVGMFEIWL